MAEWLRIQAYILIDTHIISNLLTLNEQTTKDQPMKPLWNNASLYIKNKTILFMYVRDCTYIHVCPSMSPCPYYQ